MQSACGYGGAHLGEEGAMAGAGSGAWVRTGGQGEQVFTGLKGPQCEQIPTTENITFPLYITTQSVYYTTQIQFHFAVVICIIM